MALLLSETFATGVPAGFHVQYVDYGSLVATWQSAAQAVDFVKDGYNGGWRLVGCPSAADLRVVLDIEQLSANNGGSSASGIGVGFESDQETLLPHFLSLTYEIGYVSRLRGDGASPTASVADEGSTPSAIPDLAGRHTIEFACVRGPIGFSRQYQVSVDGVLLYAGPVVSVPVAGTLLPWLWFRDSSWRLHQIDVFSDAVHLVDVGRGRMVGGAMRLPAAAWAPAGYRASGSALRHDTTYGGRRVLSGYTEIDGTPVTRVGRRRVLVWDQLTGDLVRQTWSDASGWWQVSGLADRPYLVLSPDPALDYDPAALSDVYPDPV